MSGITTNNSEIAPDTIAALPTIGEEDFDPVREIRRLRQDLAHRLELLHVAEMKAETEISPPLNDDPDRNAPPESFGDSTVEVVSETEVVRDEEPDAESTAEDCEAESPTETVEHFVDRLHQTQCLLSRLRHPLFEKEDLFVDHAERKAQASTDSARNDSDSDAEVAPEMTDVKASNWFSLLRKLNFVLVLLGMFGAVFGVLYYSRGEVRDIRIGLPLAAAGLALIVIGLAGRLIQDYLNRRIPERGKLTSAP